MGVLWSAPAQIRFMHIWQPHILAATRTNGHITLSFMLNKAPPKLSGYWGDTAMSHIHIQPFMFNMNEGESDSE